MSKPEKMKPENVVNAYLLYAQRLLNLMSSTTLTENKADSMALTASVCLSLKQTWQAWLEELSVYVGHTIPDYASVFLPENSVYPEISYLVEIGQQRDNWLSQLVVFFEPRLSVMSSTAANHDADDGLAKKISLVAIDTERELSDDERLQNIINSFKLYINAVRTRQAEW